MKGQRKSKSKTEARPEEEVIRLGITDRIEAFILELMKRENDEWLTIQRNELADIFGCVPSQINYVISTRFSPERGYIVQSRRGGGGCVRIKHIDNGTAAGSINEKAAVSEIRELVTKGYINKAAASLMSAAVSDEALAGAEDADRIRWSILRCMKNAAGIR